MYFDMSERIFRINKALELIGRQISTINTGKSWPQQGPCTPLSRKHLTDYSEILKALDSNGTVFLMKMHLVLLLFCI